MDKQATDKETTKGPSAINATIAELIAVAASMAAGFEAGVEYHVAEGRKLGIADEDLVVAANVGLKLRQASMESTVHAAKSLLAPGAEGEAKEGGCGCGHGHGGCGDDHDH